MCMTCLSTVMTYTRGKGSSVLRKVKPVLGALQFERHAIKMKPVHVLCFEARNVLDDCLAQYM